MPKKIKNCFYKNLTFEKMYEAHLRARKHKVYKDEVIKFEFNLENNLINLINKIKNRTYHLGNYYEFKIYEPKERIIKALPYVDRIVHQWYVEEFIKPNIIPKLTCDTYACIPSRGTHNASYAIQKYMQSYKRNCDNFWILKCDVKKFFYNIDPIVLYNIMKKYIQDKALLDFTHLLIFDKIHPKNSVRNSNWQLYFTVFCQHLFKRTRPIFKKRIKNKILCTLYGRFCFVAT
jgi:hypothetical protein